jgi:hypothetical protein
MGRERKVKRFGKRTWVLLAVAGVAVIAAVAGYAYFTASGSGTGTASVGSSSNIQLSSALVGTLYPGGADVPVTVNITNPGSGQQYVDDISGTVADNAGCLGAWFVVDTINYNTNLAPGAATTAGTNVRMLDSGTNQDVCQGKTMTINWSSN